jgi:hypothetical protein
MVCCDAPSEKDLAGARTRNHGVVLGGPGSARLLVVKHVGCACSVLASSCLSLTAALASAPGAALTLPFEADLRPGNASLTATACV